MAFLPGRNGYFRFDTLAFTPYTSSVDVERTVAALDTSVFGNPFTQFVEGLQDVKITAAMFFDNGTAVTGQDAILAAALQGGAKRWDYMPEGSATGRLLISGTAILTQYKITGPVNAPIAVAMALQNSGTVTRSLAA